MENIGKAQDNGGNPQQADYIGKTDCGVPEQPGTLAELAGVAAPRTPTPLTFNFKYAEGYLDAAAAENEWAPIWLRRRTEHAIRRRHHEAKVEDRSDPASEFRFYLHTLNLGGPASVELYYTVKDGEALIRGYGWDMTGRIALDDLDGGGFMIDFKATGSKESRDRMTGHAPWPFVDGEQPK
jgi:hypothetical protein